MAHAHADAQERKQARKQEQGQGQATAREQARDSAREQAILEIEDMSVSFHTPAGVVSAVSGVTWSLRQGEILGIVGESGSGKSVSVNALMRLLPKSARVTGKIRMLGRDVLKMREREFNLIRGKDVAMIFQDP
ncbi:MAG: ATP-binding cassette domain-containing protein, partial [Clostridiales bacterium]|nr:ATP-binding cassette domain-containing protein [Clostridiales bacterium]